MLGPTIIRLPVLTFNYYYYHLFIGRRAISRSRSPPLPAAHVDGPHPDRPGVFNWAERMLNAVGVGRPIFDPPLAPELKQRRSRVEECVCHADFLASLCLSPPDIAMISGNVLRLFRYRGAIICGQADNFFWLS